MTRREAILWMAVGFLGLIAICVVTVGRARAAMERDKIRPVFVFQSDTNRTVEWAGMPMVSDGGGWGHLTYVEIGLRNDGVVVWRPKEEKKP